MQPTVPHQLPPLRQPDRIAKPEPAAAQAGLDWQVAILLLAAGWLVFAWPWLTGRVTIPWDAKAHFLPQVQFMAASFARGEWPFWAPHVFAGHPQIADPQSQIFSPPMVLLALLNPAPGNHAIDATVFLCLLVAGLGILWLFHDMGWHPAGGLVAALAFVFGAAMAWRLQHFGQVLSLAYLPFALVFLHRALTRRSGRWGLAAGIVAGFIVAGRDQIGLLIVYLLIGFVLAYWLGQARKLAAVRDSILPLAAGVAGGLAVAAIPVLLTMLLAQQSNRPEIDFIGAGRGSLHPALLVTAVAPHLFGAAGDMADYWGPPSFTWRGTDLFIAQNVGQCYIGAIPLLLLFSGAARGVLWAREIRFYLIALGLVLLYALGWYTPAFRLMYEALPGVSLYRRPADAVFLIGALAAIVAGYVAHRLYSETAPTPPASRHIWVAATVAAILALGLTFAVVLERTAAAIVPLALAAGWFAIGAGAIAASGWLRPIRPLAAMALIGGITAVDLAITNGPNGATGLPPRLVEVLEPDTGNDTIAELKRLTAATRSDTRRDRVELAGLGFHWPNASLTHGLDNTLGYNPVRLARYSLATSAQDHVGLPDQRRFSPLLPSYRSPLANMLGLRFVATGVPIEEIDKQLRPGDLVLARRTKDGLIYENPAALPRVLFAHGAQRADFRELLREGRWPVVDHATTVLIEAAPGREQRRPGKVRIASYRNNEVILEADSPDGGWVVLNDVWHPWWFAEVDGRPAPLLEANVLFRAVEVPPGRATVRMSFRPLRGALAQLTGRR